MVKIIILSIKIYKLNEWTEIKFQIMHIDNSRLICFCQLELT